MQDICLAHKHSWIISGGCFPEDAISLYISAICSYNTRSIFYLLYRNFIFHFLLFFILLVAFSISLPVNVVHIWARLIDGRGSAYLWHWNLEYSAIILVFYIRTVRRTSNFTNNDILYASFFMSFMAWNILLDPCVVFSRYSRAASTLVSFIQIRSTMLTIKFCQIIFLRYR